MLSQLFLAQSIHISQTLDSPGTRRHLRIGNADDFGYLPQ